MKRNPIILFVLLLFVNASVSCISTKPERDDKARVSKKAAKTRHRSKPKSKRSKKKKISKVSKPNVVFFLVDTLRKDHLGCYGYERNTSPRIDKIAEDGMLFENAVAQAPWTPSSVASLMTSRYPSQIGVAAAVDAQGMSRGGSVSKLEDKAFTMAEAFRRAKYQTAAVSTNMYVTEKFGMLQGFEKRIHPGIIQHPICFLGTSHIEWQGGKIK